MSALQAESGRQDETLDYESSSTNAYAYVDEAEDRLKDIDQEQMKLWEARRSPVALEADYLISGTIASTQSGRSP